MYPCSITRIRGRSNGRGRHEFQINFCCFRYFVRYNIRWIQPNIFPSILPFPPTQTKCPVTKYFWHVNRYWQHQNKLRTVSSATQNDIKLLHKRCLTRWRWRKITWLSANLFVLGRRQGVYDKLFIQTTVELYQYLVYIEQSALVQPLTACSNVQTFIS
jgi:hypothetical protein